MLQATTVPTSALEPAEVSAMFRLMAAHYEAVDYASFLADFAEKDRVILLRSPAGVIQGFTTYLSYCLEHPISRAKVRAVYSGDTIIDRRQWGGQALAFEWLYQAGKTKARHAAEPLYWFLISKGPRTYRYLSAFSRSYWPHHARPTPAQESALMHALATRRFGEHYCSERGLVHFPASRGHLRPELAEVDAADRRRPEVRHFLQANPGYVYGDELVCLTELTVANLKPLSRRVFERGLRAELSPRDAASLAAPA